MHFGEIEESLIRTIRESDLSEAATTVVDAATEIPVVGVFVKLTRGFGTVRDYFFTRKVLKFLKELHSIPQPERLSQIDKLHADQTHSQRFGEHVVMLLDRLNELDKAKLMGLVVKAYIQERITLKI